MFNIINYRNKSIVQNTRSITHRILDMVNDRGSVLSDLLNKQLLDWLKKNEFKKNLTKMDLTKFKWENFKSKQIEFLDMTAEKEATFNVAKIPDNIAFAYNLLTLYK